ncbi:hypothetical protein DL96DRAFT_645290 [Flagelloscypha sp. PMI_526]|nr:hypothetical protein DL96DRAFT_645290 [Flagelloscypha sp. PMI_526]
MGVSPQRESALLLQAKEDVEYQQLIAEHRSLLQRMAQNRFRWNSGAPVSTLFPDLLVEIFLILRDDSYQKNGNTSNFWWTRGCTDVCVRWRDAALSSPALWNEVFAMSPKAKDESQQLSTVLSRSANANFTLHCFRFDFREPSTDPSLVLLSQHMPRVDALYWHVSCDPTEPFEFLFNCSKPYPNLILGAKSLRKLTFKSKKGEFRNLPSFLHSAPVLEEFHWKSLTNVAELPFVFSSEIPPFASIRRLSLVSVSGKAEAESNVMPVNDFLRLFTNLQNIFLGGTFLQGWQNLAGEPASSFNHLTSLCLGKGYLESAIHFIKIFTFPCLESITLTDISNPGSDTSKINSLLPLCLSKLSTGRKFTLTGEGSLGRIMNFSVSVDKSRDMALVEGGRPWDQAEGLALTLKDPTFMDPAPFMKKANVTTLVLHKITTKSIFSMLSSGFVSPVIFPSLQTLVLQGSASKVAPVCVSDFTTALAARWFNHVPINRLVIEEPAITVASYQVLLHLQHIRQLVVSGIVYDLADEDQSEDEAVLTDPDSDSDNDNSEWEDFWESEGEEPFWKRACGHVSDEEDQEED